MDMNLKRIVAIKLSTRIFQAIHDLFCVSKVGQFRLK
jgi:hypothetical protein